MFYLISSSNSFVETGICKYRDEFNNTAFMKRKDFGFVAKLRFNDTKVKAEALEIHLPFDENEMGATLNIKNEKGADLHSEENTAAVESFTTLVQYWIDMIFSLQLLECKDIEKCKVLMGITDEIDPEELGYLKLLKLNEFAELKTQTEPLIEEANKLFKGEE